MKICSSSIRFLDMTFAVSGTIPIFVLVSPVCFQLLLSRLNQNCFLVPKSYGRVKNNFKQTDRSHILGLR